MTKLLDRAVATLRALPVDAQDEIAQMVLLYAGDPVVKLTPEEHADLDEADAEIAHGDFATEETMRAIWAKHDR